MSEGDPKTLEEAAKTVPEDILRGLIREELDKKEAEQQEACNHGRSAQLLDASTGDIQCDDCGKVFNYANSGGGGAAEVPERVQQNLDRLLERRREEKEMTEFCDGCPKCGVILDSYPNCLGDGDYSPDGHMPACELCAAKEKELCGKP